MADSTALNVLLTANFKRLEQDLQKAGVLAEKAVNDIEGKFAKAQPKLSESFKGSFAGNLAASGIAGIVKELAKIPSMVLDANKAIAEIGTVSNRTGLSTDRIQELQFGASKQGVDSKTILSDLNAVAAKIDEITHGSENGLSKLFKDNKLQVTDLNSVLANTATLMKGASNAFEKEKIAAAVGLTKEWVPLLENGADAFNRLGADARAAGGIIDAETIQKARDFQREWDTAVANFATNARAALGPFLKILIEAVGYASKLAGVIGDKMAFTAAGPLLENGSADRPSSLPDVSTFDKIIASAKEKGIELKDEIFTLRAARAEYERVLNETPAMTIKGGGKKGTTDVSSLYSKPSGGAAKPETDQNEAAVERYIAQLEKTGRILEAERATLGLSNAERAKAIELARLGAEPDEAQLARITRILDANEKNRIAIEQINLAIRGTRDAAQFAGDQLANAFDSLLDGGKIEDAINGITKALMKAAIQAALLGQGPLAGLLGTAGGSATGGIGGIIGSLLPGRASGGPVQAGKTYMVGENGPEMVRFGKNGTVQPNAVLGSGGGSGGGVQVVVNNNAGAEVGTRETQGPGGMRQIEIMVEAAVVKNIGKNGGIAQALQKTYGNNRSAGRR